MMRQAEPAVAPDGGGITVFQSSTSHQPPQQVNCFIRRLVVSCRMTVDARLSTVEKLAAALGVQVKELLS